MSDLLIIQDAFRGERETLELYCGESLAANLRRHYPSGISGSWRIFRDAVHPDNELAAVDLPLVVVKPFEVYVLVRGALADPVSFFINLAISLALSAVATLMTPKPRRGTHAIEPDVDSSGNNGIAAQGNSIRAGGRIPEILGKVRSYPDMLCNPIETWWEKTQNIQQYFVVGMGYYDIPLGTVKLGETPITSIQGASLSQFAPDVGVPQIRAVRDSVEVRGISLMLDDGGVIAVSGATFNAAAKTMTTPTYVEINDDTPITIDGTNFNNGDFWVMDAPALGSVAPFVYQLDGPVVNETGAGPSITIWTPGSTSSWSVYYGTSSPLAPTPTAQDARFYLLEDMDVGIKVKLDAGAFGVFRGDTAYEQKVVVGVLPVSRVDTISRIRNPNGVLYTFASGAGKTTALTTYTKGTPSPPVGTDPPPPGTPLPTGWFTAPMQDPTQIWIDVAYPQGLISYTSGERRYANSDVLAEFKRADAADAQASVALPRATYATQAPLRFTHTIDVAGLTLPAGSPWIQVRLTKVTPNFIDDATHQYVQDTTWVRLAGMRYLSARPYPDVTVVALALANTRSAVSMGETSLNMIATRKLEHWDGSAFVLPRVATDRWADNFVARCRAPDGGNKTLAQIDLAGIYALQTALDAMDESTAGAHDGAQGKISLTLDQMQDIDTELIQVADIVRAVVYRVGKKIYVTRDQAVSTPIALFNARTKNPDGEAVGMRMTNDGENDAVRVTWVDELVDFKFREYTYPPDSPATNPLTVSALGANWAQAYRRAVFEWNRLRYRRESIVVTVTEDGRICRPGDVVNITDDIANLAQTAGEVLVVAGAVGARVLTLDRDVAFVAGHTYSILLRDVLGQATDTITATAVAGSADKVQLARAPVGTVTLKGRDSSTGTMYAFYDNTVASVNPWLLTSVAAAGPNVELAGSNYSTLVYQGDTGTIPARPVLVPPPTKEGEAVP